MSWCIITFLVFTILLTIYSPISLMWAKKRKNHMIEKHASKTGLLSQTLLPLPTNCTPHSLHLREYFLMSLYFCTLNWYFCPHEPSPWQPPYRWHTTQCLVLSCPWAILCRVSDGLLLVISWSVAVLLDYGSLLVHLFHGGTLRPHL